MGLEVEFEAEGPGAGAGEAGEGDDEILVVGVAGVLGDVEGEGDVGGAAGVRGKSPVAARREARSIGGAVRRVTVVLDREVGGEVGGG